MKEIDRAINTWRDVSIGVSILEAKNYPDLFDNFLTKQKLSDQRFSDPPMFLCETGL